MPIELKTSAIRKIKDYLNEQTNNFSIPKDNYTVLIVRIEINGDDFNCDLMTNTTYDNRDYCLRVMEHFVYEAKDSSLFLVGLAIDHRKRYLTDADNQLYVVYRNPKSYTHYPLLLEKKLEPNTKGEARTDDDHEQSGSGNGDVGEQTARD